MIRFHLDENVDVAVALGLRLRGFDVTTAAEAGLVQAADERHIAFAMSDQRVVLTHDQDFLRYHAAGSVHAGIVYSRQGDRSVGEIVRFLHILSDCLDTQDMRGEIEYV